MISIVIHTWNRPASTLDHSLWTLTHQSVPPAEIVVTDTSSDNAYHQEVKELCKQYPLVRLIEGRWSRFNISRGFNCGIREARSEYIATSCMELFFSEGLVEALLKRVSRDRMNFVRCGCLGPQVDVSKGPEHVRDNWAEYCSQIYPDIPEISPGALVCTTRAWWYKVHGYDENRCPYSYPDSDIQSRALRDGLIGPQPAPHKAWPKGVHVPWAEAQVLHPWHDRKQMYQTPGGILDYKAPVVRNPVQWGVVGGEEPTRSFKNL